MSFSIVAMVVRRGAAGPRVLALRIGRVWREDERGVGREQEWYGRDMTDAAGTISVKLFAGLELRTPGRRTAYEFDPREVPTIAAVTEAVGLEAGVAGLVLVNGVHAGPDHALGPGDEVALFPPLGGG
jgi:molybdopterin converting factor small subunit